MPPAVDAPPKRNKPVIEGKLSNWEVRQLLLRQQREREEEEAAMPLPGARRGQVGTSAWACHQELTTVSEQVLTYLESTPCAGQTRTRIEAFMEEASDLNLTRMEMLALVNTPPCSIVEVHLLVEECEERLTQEQRTELLRRCALLDSSGGGDGGG